MDISELWFCRGDQQLMIVDERRTNCARATQGTYNQRLALFALCLGIFMTMMDTSIVTVALPTIRDELGIPETSLVWVVNAYTLSFACSLLPGGRLGDLFGHRRMFLIGITLFTAASLLCGEAATGGILVGARALQGLGGGVVVAVALSLVVSMSEGVRERAKAIGVYGAVCASGSAFGLFAGGVLTSTLDWHSIFLINIPVGCLVIILTRSLAAADEPRVSRSRELVPTHLLRNRGLILSNLICALWAAGMAAWSFICALYMQRVLRYTPWEMGLAFLPVNFSMALLSFGLSARLVNRLDIRSTLGVGTLLGTCGFLWFSRSSIVGVYALDLLPGMILLGLAAGVMFNPLTLAATHGVTPAETGFASGMLNTASRIGGSIGLASITYLSVARTQTLIARGGELSASLSDGYRLSFLLSMACAVAAMLVSSLVRIRIHRNSPESATEITRA